MISVSFVGLYLGKMSKINMFISAIKMVIYAATVAAVVYLIQSTIVDS